MTREGQDKVMGRAVVSKTAIPGSSPTAAIFLLIINAQNTEHF